MTTHDAGGPGRAAGEQDQLRAAAERLLSRRHAEPLSDDFGEALDRARQFWADADMLARAYIALGPRLAALEAALREIATHGDDDHPCEHESITWCRAHIEKTARLALAAGRGPGE